MSGEIPEITGKRKLAWGLEPPEGAPAAWGARAIVHRTPEGSYSLDLLHDRQDVWPRAENGEARATMLRKALTTLLDGKVLQDIRLHFEAHVKALAGQLVTIRESRHPLATHRDDVVHTDVRVAGGYAYLCAFIRPDEAGWEDAHWSGAGPVPEPGDLLRVRANSIGPAIVLRRFVAKGDDRLYCGLHVLPLAPPVWYREQNGEHCSCGVFGIEIEGLSDADPEPPTPGPTFQSIGSDAALRAQAFLAQGGVVGGPQWKGPVPRSILEAAESAAREAGYLPRREVERGDLPLAPFTPEPGDRILAEQVYGPAGGLPPEIAGAIAALEEEDEDEDEDEGPTLVVIGGGGEGSASPSPELLPVYNPGDPPGKYVANPELAEQITAQQLASAKRAVERTNAEAAKAQAILDRRYDAPAEAILAELAQVEPEGLLRALEAAKPSLLDHVALRLLEGQTVEINSYNWSHAGDGVYRWFHECVGTIASFAEVNMEDPETLAALIRFSGGKVGEVEVGGGAQARCKLVRSLPFGPFVPFGTREVVQAQEQDKLQGNRDYETLANAGELVTRVAARMGVAQEVYVVGRRKDGQGYVFAHRRGYTCITEAATFAEVEALLYGPHVQITQQWADYELCGHACDVAIWLAHRECSDAKHATEDTTLSADWPGSPLPF